MLVVFPFRRSLADHQFWSPLRGVSKILSDLPSLTPSMSSDTSDLQQEFKEAFRRSFPNDSISPSQAYQHLFPDVLPYQHPSPPVTQSQSKNLTSTSTSSTVRHLTPIQSSYIPPSPSSSINMALPVPMPAHRHSTTPSFLPDQP